MVAADRATWPAPRQTLASSVSSWRSVTTMKSHGCQFPADGDRLAGLQDLVEVARRDRPAVECPDVAARPDRVPDGDVPAVGGRPGLVLLAHPHPLIAGVSGRCPAVPSLCHDLRSVTGAAAAGEQTWRRFCGAMSGSRSFLSSCDAANSSDAANPGCFSPSSQRTYSMFSIACLTVFIAIAKFQSFCSWPAWPGPGLRTLPCRCGSLALTRRPMCQSPRAACRGSRPPCGGDADRSPHVASLCHTVHDPCLSVVLSSRRAANSATG